MARSLRMKSLSSSTTVPSSCLWPMQVVPIPAACRGDSFLLSLSPTEWQGDFPLSLSKASIAGLNSSTRPLSLAGRPITSCTFLFVPFTLLLHCISLMAAHCIGANCHIIFLSSLAHATLEQKS